jgi:hypothetical protein
MPTAAKSSEPQPVLDPGQAIWRVVALEDG